MVQSWLSINVSIFFFIKRSKKQNQIKYYSWYELLISRTTETSCSKHDKWTTSLHINKPARERYRKIKDLGRCCYKFYFQYWNRSMWCNIRIEGEGGGKLVDHTSYNLPEVKKYFLVDPMHFNWHHTPLNLQIIS